MIGREGFTLIELLVVATIMIVISAIVLANNNRFGGVVQLEELSYNIALSVREAQQYGISTRRFQNTFGVGYGVYFPYQSGGANDTYATFADAITRNGIYDCPQPGTSDCELVQSYTMSGGYKINDLCVTPFSSSTETCGHTRIDVLFQRPEPDAAISYDGTVCSGGCAQSARIQLISPRGDTMNVYIYDNGQISVSSH